MPIVTWTEEFFAHVLAGPTWVTVWVAVLVIVNSMSFLFLSRKHAAFVAGIWCGVSVTMIMMYGFFGYERILGAVHVFYWTPMLVYLWPKWKRYNEKQFFDLWFRTALIVDSISLVMDYIDVARYFLGA